MDTLEDRLINFAVSIIHVCAELPKTQAGQHLAAQLLRSGTVPAPLYVVARLAETGEESAQQLNLTLRALAESGVWLRLIQRSDMLAPIQLEFVMTECAELSRLISVQLTTAKVT